MERYDAIARSLGPERARWAHAYRTMIDNGMRVVLSSDFPGTVNRLSLAVYNPLENIYMAMTRQAIRPTVQLCIAQRVIFKLYRHCVRGSFHSFFEQLVHAGLGGIRRFRRIPPLYHQFPLRLRLSFHRHQ